MSVVLPFWSSALDHIRKRRDFLAAAKGRRAGTGCCLMQGRDRGDAGALRVGFTVTKKIGNAVVRNRIRRRLREAARQVLPQAGKDGHDYVLIARHQALTMSFEGLVRDIERAVRKLHAPAAPSSSPASAAGRKARPKAGDGKAARRAPDGSGQKGSAGVRDSGSDHMGPSGAKSAQVSQHISGDSMAAVQPSPPDRSGADVHGSEVHGSVITAPLAVANADESLLPSSSMRVSDAHAPALSEAPPAADGGLPA
ncbi:ribonuclease P protein component [Xanthobacter sp. TB0139]|uniref:ribonuclease P protein component n=1 Tax=Xanthobacter sp. TB0139 TaxID=3459178 RepID=UPI004039CDD3